MSLFGAMKKVTSKSFGLAKKSASVGMKASKAASKPLTRPLGRGGR